MAIHAAISIRFKCIDIWHDDDDRLSTYSDKSDRGLVPSWGGEGDYATHGHGSGHWNRHGVGGASVYDRGHHIGSDPRGLIGYIRQQAAANGIDPDVAVRVAEHEGLGKFLGDHGMSGGAFQLYTGGGLGNKFQQETGLDPLDPKNERATIAWAMEYAGKTKSWGPWHGAPRAGVGEHEGFGNAPRDIPEASLGGSGAGAAGQAESMEGMRDANPIERSKLTNYLGVDPKNEDWCAEFVGASVRKAGGSLPEGYRTATNWANYGRPLSKGETPQRGDIFVEMRGLSPGTRGGHVGIVTGPQTSSGEVPTIEGDRRNRSGGHMVLPDTIDPRDVLIRRPTDLRSDLGSSLQVASMGEVPHWMAASKKPDFSGSDEQIFKKMDQDDALMKGRDIGHYQTGNILRGGKHDMGDMRGNKPFEQKTKFPNALEREGIPGSKFNFDRDDV